MKCKLVRGAPNSGFSLVEALVATVFIAIVALSGLTSFVYFRGVKHRSKDVCRAHVAGIVDSFRSIGYFTSFNNFTPIDASKVFLGVPAQSLSAQGIPNTALWPSSRYVLQRVGSNNVVDNTVLITSSINALLTIYNSNPSYCATGDVYAGSITAPDPNLRNSSVAIQIQPYNTRSGALLGCPSPLSISPEPLNDDTHANSAYGQNPRKAARPVGNLPHTGLNVRVTQVYEDEDGLSASCSIDQRFQYAADTNLPMPPDYFSMQRLAGPNWNTVCPANLANHFEVVVGYNSRNIETGSVMLCRDVSVITPTPAATYGMALCLNGPPGLGTVVGRRVEGSYEGYFPPANRTPGGVGYQTGLVYQTGYDTRNANTSLNWVPCDEVTACGVMPETKTLEASSTPERPKYRLTYRNLPPLCRVVIQATAIDTALNPSDNSMTAGTGPSNTTFNNVTTALTFDVPIPRCGHPCGNGGYNNMKGAPSSLYFRCGSCPP